MKLSTIKIIVREFERDFSEHADITRSDIIGNLLAQYNGCMGFSDSVLFNQDSRAPMFDDYLQDR